jgi:transcriptional regulator
MQEQIDHIKQLNCKKHIKIFKLKQLGLKNKEIANELGTNAGHVYNALKTYSNNEERINQANAL